MEGKIIGKVPVEALGLWYYVNERGVIYSLPMKVDGSADDFEGVVSIVGPYFDDGVEVTFLDDTEEGRKHESTEIPQG